MKIVINGHYGCFGVSDEALKILGEGFDEWDDGCRTDARLISLIEEKGSDFVSDEYADLKVIEIPDEVTDWEISDYDGSETLIYVLGGKLHHA